MDGNLCVSLVASLRKQCGQAAFLLLVLMKCAPLDWNGDAPAYVADGALISDAWLMTQLNASPRRLSAWRKKLRAAGRLDWTLKPGQGRVYVLGVLANAKPASESVASSSASQTEESETLGSRLVQ